MDVCHLYGDAVDGCSCLWLLMLSVALHASEGDPQGVSTSMAYNMDT